MPKSPIKDRTIRFSFRLTQAENETFTKAAKAARMDRSTYARRAVLKKKITVKDVPETNSLMAGYVAGIINQLRQLGNNVNQMSKALNTAAKLGVIPTNAPDGQTLKDVNLAIRNGIRDIATLQDELMGRKEPRKKIARK